MHESASSSPLATSFDPLACAAADADTAAAGLPVAVDDPRAISNAFAQAFRVLETMLRSSASSVPLK
jgi:hypothetical protein